MAWYYTSWSCINSLSNDKVPAGSKLKVFADVKIKLAEMMIFVFDRIKNIVGKAENAVNQLFTFSCNVFKGLIM